MFDLTAASNVLKVIYLPGMQNQHNTSTIFMNEVNKTGKHIMAGGLQAEQPILLATPQGIGSRADNAPLPAVVSSSYQKRVIPIVSNYMRIGVTGKTMRACESDKNAFVKAVGGEIQNQTEMFLRDENRQHLSADGTGKIAQFGIFPIGTTVITGISSTVNLYENGRYEIWEAPVPSGGTQMGGVYEIASVDSDTQVTLKTALTVATTSTNSYFIREGNKDNEIIGLLAGFDDGSYLNVYETINRTTYPRWKAKVLKNGGTDRALSLDLMQEAYTHREKAGSGTDIILSSFKQRDKLVALLILKQNFYNSQEWKPGFTAIKFNSANMLADEQFPDDQILFPAWKYINLHRQAPLTWQDKDGSVLRNVPGYDTFEAYAYADRAVGISRCNAGSAIRDLIHT